MRTLREGAWILAGLSVSGLAIILGLATLRASKESAKIAAQLESTLSEIRVTASNVRKASDDNYWDARASAETTAALLKRTYDLVDKADRNLNDEQGVLPRAAAAVSKVEALSVSLASLSESVKTDANSLLGPGGAANKDLVGLSALLQSANEEVRREGAKSSVVLDNLTKSTSDLDKLLADPNIASTLAHVDKTSEHIQNSAESVDLALLPLRKKANLLKMVILKAIGFFRVAWTI